MKGVELPINVLIIVAVALIVLLALVALYFTGFNPFTGAVGLESIKNDACRTLAQLNRCQAEPRDVTIEDFDADLDDSMDPGRGIGAPNPVEEPADCPDDTAPGLTGDNLHTLCVCWYNLNLTNNIGACKAMCGCPGY